MHARALFARYCDPAQAALEPIFKIDFPNGVSLERLARAFILKKQQTLATPTTPRPGPGELYIKLAITVYTNNTYIYQEYVLYVFCFRILRPSAEPYLMA